MKSRVRHSGFKCRRKSTLFLLTFKKVKIRTLIIALIASVLFVAHTKADDNNPPTLYSIRDRQGPEKEWLVIKKIIARDPDGDILTMQITNRPSGAKFIKVEDRPGYIEYKLKWPSRFVKQGVYENITFTVNDGNGGEVSESITITITDTGNLNPALRSIRDRSGREGEWFVIKKIIATDDDSDNLTMTAINLPSRVRFIKEDDRPGYIEYKVKWRPEHVQAGVYENVTFTVKDAVGAEDSEVITINIIGGGNQAPTIQSIGDRQGQEGEWFIISRIVATDPDNDTLTIETANLPSGTRFFQTSSSPGRVEYKLKWPDRFVQTGVYENVAFTAQDGNGGEDSEIITITITDTTPPGQPVVNSVTSPTNLQTQTITGTKSDDTATILITSSQATSSPLSYPTSTSWSCTVTLQEGNNGFAVIAEDEEGNQSLPVEFTIILDTTPPEIHITDPEDNTVTGVDSITVSGTMDDNDATVEVNGVITTVTESTFTAQNIFLSEGENTISATATDTAGNTSSDNIRITYIVPPETAQEALQKVADNYALLYDMKADMTLSATLDGEIFGDIEYCIYYFLKLNETDAIKQKTVTYASADRVTKKDIIIIDGSNMYLVNPDTQEVQTVSLLSETGMTAEQFSQMDICYNLTEFLNEHIVTKNDSKSDLANYIVVVEATPNNPNSLYSKLEMYIDYRKGLLAKSLLYKGEETPELKQIIEITASQEMSSGAWVPVTMIKKPIIESGELITTMTYSDIEINIGLTEVDFDPHNQ